MGRGRTGGTNADEIETVMFDAESVTFRDGGGERRDAFFEVGWDIDVDDGSTLLTDEVMVMAGEVFGEFVARGIVGRNQSSHDSGVFKYRKISVGRTLGHAGRNFDELEHRDGSISVAESIDQHASIRGVALSISTESLVGGVVHVDLFRMHGRSSLRGLRIQAMGAGDVGSPTWRVLIRRVSSQGRRRLTAPVPSIAAGFAWR